MTMLRTNIGFEPSATPYACEESTRDWTCPAAARRQDWPLWMLREFMAANFVLMIASPEYKRRAEGRAPPGEGLGVQWEASLIRNDVYGRPYEALQRYIPVVLPGCSVTDIPLWMGPNSTTHYTISDYTPVGMSELVRFLTQGRVENSYSLKPLTAKLPDQAPLSASTADKLRCDILRRLTQRPQYRDQSMIHADIEQLLFIGGLGLEPQDIGYSHTAYPDRSNRIDIETGSTVIEVERDLSAPGALRSAEHQLNSYLAIRREQTGERYAGIATDGLKWNLYLTIDGQLKKLGSFTADPSGANTDALLTWLESAFGTGKDISPDPHEIVGRLGADSPGYALDSAELHALYKKYHQLPHVLIKRAMWARLLTTASGTHFIDEDLLFVNHTLLVAIAKVIGHAVMRYKPESPQVSAGSIMAGSAFSRSQITGVIETDFFDWLVDVPGGEQFIKLLARRLTRFAWNDVKHDVLKSLYNSIIKKETRKQLGEHYTPDWLADYIVTECVTEPLHQRVLDASCGSGTFLFYAVRRYLDAADKAATPTVEALRSLVTHVLGIDVHPVAVTLARVTYLLAIGMERLRSNQHPAFTVPVYLGDSLKWGTEQTLWSNEALNIPTDDDYQVFINDPNFIDDEDFDDHLKFPNAVVADSEHFDALVSELADKAASRGVDDPKPSLDQVFESFSIRSEDQHILQRTFENMCELHDSGRDHIWGYYVRNLARPAWLARPGNRVDVLVGNPPWLAYRYMTELQQQSFKTMSINRRLWAGASHAPTQDLSGLFVVRCIEQYLRAGGRFGFVMPGGVLTLGQYEGFRTGAYSTRADHVVTRFNRPWDLHGVKPKFFSQHVGVVFGRRGDNEEGAVALTLEPEVWSSSKFATETASKEEAEAHIIRTVSEPLLKPTWKASPYAKGFHQGASLVPRFLFVVKPDNDSPLGAGIGRRTVKSSRSNRENPPWKGLPGLHETIEEQFIKPLFLGDSILPFCCLSPAEAIIPWDGRRLLNGSAKDLYPYKGLAVWWHHADNIWERYRSKVGLSFGEQLDYMGKLSKQLPCATLRVVFNKSGTYLAAAVVTDSAAVIDQQLYWRSVASLEEGRFLTAILNSTPVTLTIRHLQPRGENNPRDFAKLVFKLPIPFYNEADPEHRRLTVLAMQAEHVAQEVRPQNGRSRPNRRQVREALVKDGIGAEIDSAVKTLLA